MERAVQRGVSVRLLADFIASRKVAESDKTFAELDRIGVVWSYMLPVRPFHGEYSRPDLRNHRKLVVVDGRVGFMGSQNLIDRSYNSPKNIKRGLQWQELMTRVTGPIVTSINAVFLSDWYLETGDLLDRHGERSCRERRTGHIRRCPGLPGRAERTGLRRREQPAAVPHAGHLRAGEGDHHEPLLRSG